ncbi:hypothetical protein ES703_71808 [subsurface metagenome]
MKKNNVEEYIDCPYSVIVVPDTTTDGEPCYLAYHHELEGCMSHGNTPEEALHNLREATRLYISVLLDEGLEVPLPEDIFDRLNITWDVFTSEDEVPQDIYIIEPVEPPMSVSVTQILK